MRPPTANRQPPIRSRGYTLIELIVAVGLFALIMTLASGAYFIVINLGRQVQGVSTGINNLSFALETMTRNIRTGTDYDCGDSGDCPNGSSSFSFKNADGEPISYGLSGSSIQETKNGISSILTDPSVSVSSLNFYAIGTENTDAEQPRVTIIISGNVAYGAGKTEQFSVETGATMRGSDLLSSSGESSPAPPAPPPASVVGQVAYTTPGTYSWTAPAGVTSVSVVVVGGGGGGGGSGGGGGGGGGLAYRNNISVTPGNSYPIVVGSAGLGNYEASGSPTNGSASSAFSSVAGGGLIGSNVGVPSGTYTGGGSGGIGGSYKGGGGGAGGYSGNGGNGGGEYTSGSAGTGGAAGGAAGGNPQGNWGTYGGGGVGIFGQGASGNGGIAVYNGGYSGGGGGGSGGESGKAPVQGNTQNGGTGGNYGGGGSAGSGYGGQGNSGGIGAVRIIWPGNERQFPSTRTANE